MSQSPKSLAEKARGWTPRALAVLSCALALLAAQPASATPITHAAPQVSHVQVSAASAPVKITRECSPRTTAKAQTQLFTAARQLHVLATFEILKRILIAELALPQTHLWQPAIQFAELPLFELAPLSPPRITVAQFDQSPLPCSPEHLFAIEHCLLAPPLV